MILRTMVRCLPNTPQDMVSICNNSEIGEIPADEFMSICAVPIIIHLLTSVEWKPLLVTWTIGLVCFLISVWSTSNQYISMTNFMFLLFYLAMLPVHYTIHTTTMLNFVLRLQEQRYKASNEHRTNNQHHQHHQLQHHDQDNEKENDDRSLNTERTTSSKLSQLSSITSSVSGTLVSPEYSSSITSSVTGTKVSPEHHAYVERIRQRKAYVQQRKNDNLSVHIPHITTNALLMTTLY